ncbi:hypothetical protein TNCV_3679921 [Trichonephila clavipes]|nr:hypothetical protein TNCV_3679921 [Trichonephila clavipes]
MPQALRKIAGGRLCHMLKQRSHMGSAMSFHHTPDLLYNIKTQRFRTRQDDTKVAKLVVNMVSKNDANLALPPRFRQDRPYNERDGIACE